MESQDLRPELLFFQQRRPGPCSERTATKRYDKLFRLLEHAILRERETSKQEKQESGDSHLMGQYTSGGQVLSSAGPAAEGKQKAKTDTGDNGAQKGGNEPKGDGKAATPSSENCDSQGVGSRRCAMFIHGVCKAKDSPETHATPDGPEEKEYDTNLHMRVTRRDLPRHPRRSQRGASAGGPGTVRMATGAVISRRTRLLRRRLLRRLRSRTAVLAVPGGEAAPSRLAASPPPPLKAS